MQSYSTEGYKSSSMKKNTAYSYIVERTKNVCKYFYSRMHNQHYVEDTFIATVKLPFCTSNIVKLK